MRVGELKKLLADYSDDQMIVIAKDAEGNMFSPLAGISEGCYLPEAPYYGYMADPDDAEDHDGTINVLILDPMN
jgi:hypothetical protein